jgi:hypothetical protein
MLTTLKQFILKCFANPGMEYELFEDSCSDSLRDQIYSLADPDSPEPFRSAMHNIGFDNY